MFLPRSRTVRILCTAIAVFLLSGGSAGAYAAIAFDAASTGTGTTNATTVSDTVGTGDNRMLVVGTSMEHSPAAVVSSVTYNGTALTKAISHTTTTGGTENAAELWYLANPSSGSHDVVVTYDVSTSHAVGVVSLSGVAQQAPQGTGGAHENSLATVTANLTTQSDNAWLIDVGSNGNTGSWTPGSGQTERLEADGSSMSIAMSTREQATAGAGSMTQTAPSTNRTVVVAAAFAPAVPVDYSSWTYSRDITLNTSSTGANVTGDVQNFPVLIRLNGTNFPFAEALPGGADLRFATSEGVALPYEIERWDEAGQQAEVWVKVDDIQGNNSSQYITMHWGASTGSATASESDASAVFQTTNGFAGVWQFKDGTPFSDATANNNDGTSGGGSVAEGVAGKGRSFTGAVSDIIDCGSGGSLRIANTLTISTWYYLDATGDIEADDPYLACLRKENWNSNYGLHVDKSDPELELTLSTNGGTGRTFGGGLNTATAGEWVFFAATYDATQSGTDTYVFRGEAGQGFSVLNSADNDWGTIDAIDGNYADLEFYIGGNSNSERQWVGELDEVRVSNAIRSPDWLELCYENQKPNQSLVEMDGETPPEPAVGDGMLVREYWTGISGTDIVDLTSSSDYPANPTGTGTISTFECPVDWNDSYGTRVYGYITPPTTGDYTFWIASDDAGELYLSSNADPANKVKIASVDGWTNSREWDKEASQQSAPVTLTVGEWYYIEALHKEGGGGDNLAVGWQGPGIGGDTERPVPGVRLSTHVPGPPEAQQVVYFAAPGASSYNRIPVADSKGSSWAQDRNADGNTIVMQGQEYQRGVAGQPPAVIDEFNWVLYDIDSYISSLPVSGAAPLRMVGYAGHQDGSGSVDVYIRTSSATEQPASSEWINATGAVDHHMHVSSSQSNQVVDIDMSGVKWVWLGVESGSIDANDYGIWADLQVYVDVPYEDGDDYAGWTWARDFVLNTTATGADVTETVEDFPVLIRLDQNTFDFTQADPGGRDIRFSTPTGEHLRYHIEQWDAALQTAAVWVRVPEVLGNNATQSITMHWGNAAAESRSSGKAVFDAAKGYAGVYHLNGDLLDATTNGNDGADEGGSTAGGGIVAGGRHFDRDQRIRIPHDGSLNFEETTMSCWFRMDVAPSSWTCNEPRLWDKTFDRAFSVALNRNDNHTPSEPGFRMTGLNGSPGIIYSTTGAISASTGVWQHLTVAYENGEARFYVNGVLDRTIPGLGTLKKNNDPAHIANRTDWARDFEGTIDEMWLSRTARSAAYVKLCYENQKENQTLVNSGSTISRSLEVFMRELAASTQPREESLDGYYSNNRIEFVGDVKAEVIPAQ